MSQPTVTPHGWPDASKPGVPLNPERDGWHWLQDANGDLWCWRWYPSHQWFWAGNRTVRPREATTEYRYLGPCITPDEIEAREAAAAEAMRQSAEDRATRDGAYTTSAHIRALPLPAADALARALDQARAEEREACIVAIEKHAAEIGRQECCGIGQSTGYGPPECCGDPALMISDREAVRAIRARGKETSGE